jgi:hypothetical protein
MTLPCRWRFQVTRTYESPASQLTLAPGAASAHQPVTAVPRTQAAGQEAGQ